MNLLNNLEIEDHTMKRFKPLVPWLISLLLVLMLYSFLAVYVKSGIQKEVYRISPVIVLIVGIVYYRRWRVAPPSDLMVASWFNRAMILLLFFLVGISHILNSSWLAMVTLFLGLGVLMYSLAGFRKVDQAFGLWALMGLTVRLPYFFEERLVRFSEGLSTRIASTVLDASGIQHVVQTHFLTMDGHQVDAEAISHSYYSFIGVIALAGFYALWRRRTWVGVLCLLVGGVGITIGVNAMRIALVGLVYEQSGMDLMGTWWSWVLLGGSYLVSLLILFSYDGVVQFMFAEIPAENRKGNGRSLGRIWNGVLGLRLSRVGGLMMTRRECGGGIFTTLLGGLVMVCVLTSLVVAGKSLYNRGSLLGAEPLGMLPYEELTVIQGEDLSFDRPGWALVNTFTEERETDSIWGRYSVIWRLSYKSHMVTFAVDYPFDEWHDVKRCYQILGWKVLEEGVVLDGAYEDWWTSVTTMEPVSGGYGYILCSHADHEGAKILAKPPSYGRARIQYYLDDQHFKDEPRQATETFYQMQAAVETAEPLSAEDKEEILVMYAEFREQARRIFERESQR